MVQDMLEGYVKAFPRRVRLLGNHILLRAKEKDLSKTAVIIGNGSGHEPAMIDLVGEGLFDANVCGKIFCGTLTNGNDGCTKGAFKEWS